MFGRVKFLIRREISCGCVASSLLDDAAQKKLNKPYNFSKLLYFVHFSKCWNEIGEDKRMKIISSIINVLNHAFRFPYRIGRALSNSGPLKPCLTIICIYILQSFPT